MDNDIKVKVNWISGGRFSRLKTHTNLGFFGGVQGNKFYSKKKVPIRGLPHEVGQKMQ